MVASNRAVILTYHSIADGDSPLKISPALFAKQMQWLAANARAISLSQLVDGLTGGAERLHPRCIVLTFDDGYADFYAHAAPVLLKHKLPATVFLPTAYVGRTNVWPGQPSWVKEGPLMNWEQVRELARAGIKFASHTVSHPDLTSLPPAEVERELAESKHEIEQRAGQNIVEHFCYPYGKWNPSVRACAMRHYRSACTTIAGTLRDTHERGPNDQCLLPRVDAHYVRNPLWFRSMFTHRFEAYITARRLMRRLRGQPEGGYPST